MVPFAFSVVPPIWARFVVVQMGYLSGRARRGSAVTQSRLMRELPYLV